MPLNLRASQGTYINCVVVEWDGDASEPNYTLWYGSDSLWCGMVYSTKETRYIDNWDMQVDNDSMPGFNIRCFKHYYRVYTTEDAELKSESAKAEGYSANIRKAMVTATFRSADQSAITVTWQDDNPLFLNEISRHYQIHIMEENGEHGYGGSYDYYGTELSYRIPIRNSDFRYKVSVTLEITYDPMIFLGTYFNCWIEGDYYLENQVLTP